MYYGVARTGWRRRGGEIKRAREMRGRNAKRCAEEKEEREQERYEHRPPRSRGRRARSGVGGGGEERRGEERSSGRGEKKVREGG